METQKPITRFEYDLIHEENGIYLATMIQSIRGSGKSMPYKIGDDIPLTDEFIHGNNSVRLRTCIVQRITQDEILPYRYVVHLRPTKKEFKPFARLDWRNIFRKKTSGVDWDGLDGYLKIDA